MKIHLTGTVNACVQVVDGNINEEPSQSSLSAYVHRIISMALWA
jgi:hypothetical protein